MMKRASDINILLVNPWIHDFKAYDLWLKPLGLLYIASLLKGSGFNVHLLDCLHRRHPSVSNKMKFRKDGTGKFYEEEIEKPLVYKDIPRRYKRYGIPKDTITASLNEIPKPHIILVTSIMTYWFLGVKETIKTLKDKFHNTPIVLGGIYAALCPQHAKDYSGADINAGGIAFNEIVPLVCRLTGVEPSCEKNITGITPDFSLYKKIDYYTLLSSFGCPFRCSYCASGKLNPNFSQRKPEAVVDEIMNASDSLGVQRFAFYDDALLVNRKNHIIPILKLLIKRKQTPLTFYTPNGLHAKYLDEETAELMYEAGFDQLRISLESVDEEYLKKSGAKVVCQDVKTAVKNLTKAGFTGNQIGIYLMMGLPDQGYDQCLKAIKYVHGLGVQIRLSHYSPVPGTIDYNEGVLKAENPEDIPLLHNNTYHFYLNEKLSIEQKQFLKDTAFQFNAVLLKSS